MKYYFRLLFALSGLACFSPANAQLSLLPPEVAQKVREIGPILEVPNTAALFAPFQQKEPYPGVAIERDIAYGSHDRNKLDVFTPVKADAAPRPVLIFVHGGAYIAGNKRTGTSPYYDNVMLAALKAGFVGVNITYRLAPAHKYPAATEDVAQAVRWVLDNIAASGGDPARVYIMGHSAGATHVANYIAHAQGDKGGVRGAILLSGVFDFILYPTAPNVIAYFGEDRTTYKERSSINGLVASRVPMLVIDAELDAPRFPPQTKALTDALCAAERRPTRVTLKGHSHISEVYSINTKDQEVIEAVTAFAKKNN